MSEHIHWHRTGDEPSQLLPLPRCCATVLQARVRDERRTAEHEAADERRRLILNAVQRVEDHRAAIKVLISVDADRDLADRVAAHCIELIRAAACICPDLDIHSFGEMEPRTIKGRDPRCGAHVEVEPCNP